MKSDLTPMMRQYLGIKEKHKDAILFFRLGDFYEMFFDDALEATKILHITLTSRAGGKAGKIPMCGIPYHAASNYIARLIKSGKKVAICEQIEEPVPGKKLVDRQVTKVITPGTFMADGMLDGSINNYILSLNASSMGFGIAYCDLSTGEFRVTELNTIEDLFSELFKISPSECLISDTLSREKYFQKISDINLGALTISDDWMFDYELSLKEIKGHFLVDNLEGFGCQDLSLAIGATGALLKYLKDTQKSHLKNIDVISTYNPDQFMSMDSNSQRHLELIQNSEDLGIKGTLFEVLDKIKTPMGKRRLKREILNPMIDPEHINYRLDGVQYFYDNGEVRHKVRTFLGDIYDMERLSNKISLGTANGRDMQALGQSLKNIDKLKLCLNGTIPLAVNDIVKGMDDFKDIIDDIEKYIVQEPPVSLKEGGIINDGVDSQVDELRYIISNAKDWVAGLKKKEIEKTGISSLKIGFNKVFGYYIEVTKANIDSVPENYVRKQTLVNAERYITQELKEQESKIIGAQDRIKDLEYDLFIDLRSRISNQFDRLKRTSDQITMLDILQDLAEVAALNGYVRPKVDNGSSINITEGRHPVLEKILKDKEFVPNDVVMDDGDNRIFIITGSNMAGKSTYIRQVSLITVMAQIGSYVPAKEAQIGVVDRIFTRVGASDRLYRGMSTFMVEMLETANILNNATERSLIILDEIGRGTSTYDGVSIAWAVVEFIHNKLSGAKAMFATHYHELTELSSLMSGVKNYHLAVQEWGEEIVFLYKTVEGSCDESFGIHVAKLAGLPKDVVNRARQILENLQKDSFLGNIKQRFSNEKELNEKQYDFFSGATKEHPVIKEIKDLDIDSMTPIDALKKLSELKKDVID